MSRPDVTFDVNYDGGDVYLQVDGQDLVHIELPVEGGEARIVVWASTEAKAEKAFEGEVNLTAHLEADPGWPCPGCGQVVEPSDVRRHASECDKYDGSQGY